MLYLIDANVLIDANRDYYPIGRVPQFWDWLVVMGQQGLVKVPLEIYEEIIVGNDALTSWLKDNKNAILLGESVSANMVANVVDRGYANDLTDDELLKMGNDPFLIAYALADRNRRCVVTTEASRPSRVRANRHIPDVCSDSNIDVPCIDTFQLVRDLDFRTGNPY